MSSASKSLTLLLVVILVVSGLMIVQSAFAQSIPKPSVPEFKLSYTNHVYDVPAATSQWSGEPIPNSGYHYNYREVYTKVRNQPNDAYVNENSVNNGVREKLYYNVRVQNHFSNDWVELWGQSPVYASNGSIITGTWYWGASDSEVTNMGSISLNGPTNIIHASKDVAVGNQVDFQVKALIGYQNFEKYSFFGEESDWSETQTITFSEASTSNIPNPLSPTTPTITLTPIPPDTNSNSITMPMDIFMAIIAFFASALVILSVLLYRRHRKDNNLSK